MGSHRLIKPLRSEGKGPLGEAVAVDPVAVFTVFCSGPFNQFPVQQAGTLDVVEPEGRPVILRYAGLSVTGGEGQLWEGRKVEDPRHCSPAHSVIFS